MPIALRLAVALAAAFAFGTAAAERPSAETPAAMATQVFLWPGGTAPGSTAVEIEQRIVERSDEQRLPDRIITGITRPYFIVHRPAKPNGRALLVMPGGAYRRIVLDKEGSALVPEFVDRRGYTLFVLRYRLPGDGHAEAGDAPLADAQRAMRLIRANADNWGVDPARIGAIGFSAGGHAAASLGTRYDDRVYAPVDGADRLSARPDFLLLMYPVIDMGEGGRCRSAAGGVRGRPAMEDRAGKNGYGRDGGSDGCSPIFHAVSREHLLGANPSRAAIHAHSLQNRVHAGMPPVFLLHAADDASVPLDNSLVLFDALRGAGVPAEFHVYAEGGHGFGVRDIDGLPLGLWPQMADAWIRSNVEREGGVHAGK